MSFSDKAKQIIGAVAPTLGLALGGPLGGMAGKLIHDALGSGGDDKAAEAALMNATPETLLALKKADQDFTVKMKELGIEEDKLVFDDRANARLREMTVKDNTPAILAYCVCGFTALIEGFIVVHGSPPNVDGVILGRILGSLDAASMMALAYYFGTSAGSRKNQEALASIAKGTQT